MISLWEKEAFIHYDHIIVGSGITGLSTAATIKEQSPNSSVLVLEKGLLPSGASTKNAGFACFGSPTEILQDIQIMGMDKALELIELRWKGLALLRKRLGDDNMGFQQVGGYELYFEGQEDTLEKVHELNRLLKPIFNQEVFHAATNKIEQFGFNAMLIKQIVFNPLEGHLHPGLMMHHLIDYVQKQGTRIINGSEVTGYNCDSDFPSKSRAGNEPIEIFTKDIAFKCKNLMICTNGFATELLKNVNVQPGRGLVLVTSPLDKTPFRGTFHYDEGYYYFRDLGNRILFGGGRNIDFDSENTTQFGINENIKKKLMYDLSEIIIPGKNFTIDYSWSGIMGFASDKYPIIKEVSPNIFAGVKLGGMGIALGSYVGQKLALLALGQVIFR